MAADGRRHIIAIGGGMLAPEGQVPVHLANALRLTGQREPRLCVLNTAGGDDPRWTLAMYDRLAGQPVRVSHLALFPMPNVRDPEDLLLSQDVIFIGGGSVANMLAVWRVHGLDVILRKAWQAGIVLAGSSAGGICWFEGGTTDSFGRDLRVFTDGLGLLPGSYCPHYNSEPGRAPAVPPAGRRRHPARRDRLRRRGRGALHRRHADRADRRPPHLGRLPRHPLRRLRHRNPTANPLPEPGRFRSGVKPGIHHARGRWNPGSTTLGMGASGGTAGASGGTAGRRG